MPTHAHTHTPMALPTHILRREGVRRPGQACNTHPKCSSRSSASIAVVAAPPWRCARIQKRGRFEGLGAWEDKRRLRRLRVDSGRAVRPSAMGSRQSAMDECWGFPVTCPACAGPIMGPSPATGISCTRHVRSGHPVWTRYPGPPPLGAAGP